MSHDFQKNRRSKQYQIHLRIIVKIYLRFKMYPVSIIQKWKYNSLNAGNIKKTVELLKKKSRRPTFISNCIVYGLATYIF